MKALTIIRHAKAERPEGYATDFERPLTERGLKDAARAADILARIEPAVDWWLSSPALRCRQTSERMVTAYGYTNNIQWEPTVYEAAPETLLSLLGQIPQDIQHVVLVGHNPGVTYLVAGLVAGAAEHMNLEMATAAVAHVQLEIFWWKQIRWGCGRLEFLVTPKLLKK